MFLVAFYGVFTLGASSAFGEIPPAILIDPSPDDLIFLAYSLAGATPPFDTWGAADPSVTSLDEFHQAAAAQALSAKMQARYNKIKGTTEIRIAVDTTFGDYNTQYGEFDFDINDGTNVPYQTPLNQGGLIVNLTNGGLAQSWTISASDAEKVLALTKGSRNVVLTMTLKLNDATLPVESGDQIAIDATVLEYDIAEQFNSMRLGHVVVSQ
jgi:hypothetical protein